MAPRFQFEIQREGATALLSLNHGKANEMGEDQIHAFDRLADTLERDGTRALITWSERRSSRGTPLFISGANVTERGAWSAEKIRAHVEFQRRVVGRIRALPLLHVAVVSGVALGWGTEFVIACDYRIATAEATFGLPETGLGILPGAGGTAHLWSQIGVAQALRLGMTGEHIGADEAARIGLVQEVSATLQDGLQRARDLGRRVEQASPSAVAAFKAACLGGVGRSPAEREALEAGAYELCLESGDAAVGRKYFAEIRKGRSVPWGPRMDLEL